MNELGFTEEYLRTIWAKGVMNLLAEFLIGQTLGIVDGKVTIYFFDIQNFCSQYGIKFPTMTEGI